MKKYLQIGIVVVIFGVLVLIRQLYGNNDKQNTDTATTASHNTAPTSQTTPTTGTSAAKYKDGTYTGPVTNAYYGYVQVQATIASGKITQVQFLVYPNDNPTTRQINNEAMPVLISEAIQKQSARVDVVTSASQTSEAFIQSLSSALQQAI